MIRAGVVTVAAVPVAAAAALAVLSAVFADLRRRHLSRVFLCYASEDEAVARRLELALVGERHTVFFAPQKLAGSDEYYRAIRQAIARAEVFVFLLSRASVQPGRFTLTEVAEAERRWPHPKGRVLTVTLDSTPASAAPPYLQAVTILKPAGDAVADATNRIAAMLGAIRRPLDLAFAATLGVAVLAWVWLIWRR